MSTDSIFVSNPDTDSIVMCGADSTNTFTAGVLELPTRPPETVLQTETSSMTGTILSALSLFVILLLFKRIVNTIPSLFACLLRWKESINLEASVKISNDRTIIAIAMIVPFCLVVENYELYSPAYMYCISDSWKIVATVGTFLLYIALRALAGLVCKPSKSSKNTYNAGFKASWTFFIILTLMLLATGGITSFANLDCSTAKITMHWISIVIYLLLLVREFQIFASSCSFVTAFLYLCALEIVPSGLLVGSVYVF